MIMDSVADLLPGLLPASFRGVGFHVPDTSSEHGRRVAEYLFPGVDGAAFDDFGLSPAVIQISGILVGDDYVAQARALQAAFERPGPGTLIHPWLGGMTVILFEPGEISLSASELRVVRFSAAFKKAGSGGGIGSAFGATAALLFAAVNTMRDASTAIAAAPMNRTSSQVRFNATERSWRIVRGAWVEGAGGRAFPARALPTAIPQDPARYALSVRAATDVLLAAVPALKATPAIAPGGEAVAGMTGLEAEAAIAICLAVAATVGAADAPSVPDRAMLAGAAGDMLAGAAHLSAYVGHPSRSEAFALRYRLMSAIGAHADTLAKLDSSAFADTASAASRATSELKLRVVADINETIGRLPSVISLQTDRDADAWQVANHLYGDDPASIEAGYRIVVSRNRPRHPARLPAGRIEALR